MAIVTVDTNLKLGFDQRAVATGTQSTINSTTTGVALPFYAQFTGSITRVVLSATVTTAVTNLDVGLMGSNAAGNLPDNTYIATPNTVSLSVSSTPTNYVINLTNAISVTKGTVYWLAFRPNASFTGSVSVYQNFFGIYSYNGQWRSATRIASNWIQGGVTGSNVSYGSATKWYSFDQATVPAPTTFTPAANQEYGVAFTLDTDHPAVKVDSISFVNGLNTAATGGNPGMGFLCKIYNSAGTLLYTFSTQDTDRYSNAVAFRYSYVYNQSGSDIWFEPNTKYYVMFAFTGTFTTAPTWSKYSYDSSLSAANGAYTSNYAERSSGGVITETTTDFMSFSLKIGSIRYDSSAGGGGGYIDSSPMFNGGFSG